MLGYLRPGALYQATVRHPRGTRNLTGAAPKAQVPVGHHPLADAKTTLPNTLHQGYPASGRLGLKTSLHIGRTDAEAQTAVNAAVQVLIPRYVKSRKGRASVQGNRVFVSHG